MSDMVVACPTCGVVHEDLANAENEIRRLRRANTALKNELQKQRKDSPNAQAARELFEFWRDRCGKNKNTKFDDAREKMLLRALEIHDPETLRKAVKGLALLPFVGPKGRQKTGTPRQRYDDLSYAVKDAEHIERFCGYVDAEFEEFTQEVAKGMDAQLPPEPPRIAPLSLRNVLEAFEERGLKTTGRAAQFKGQCPIHEDRTPSVSITEKPDGRVLLNCFGCGAGHLDLARALELYVRRQEPRTDGQLDMGVAA